MIKKRLVFYTRTTLSTKLQTNENLTSNFQQFFEILAKKQKMFKSIARREY